MLEEGREAEVEVEGAKRRHFCLRWCCWRRVEVEAKDEAEAEDEYDDDGIRRMDSRGLGWWGAVLVKFSTRDIYTAELPLPSWSCFK